MAPGMLAAKQAAVFGFANHRSLAWGVAASWAAAGATVSFGLAHERFRPALSRLTSGWAVPPHVFICDVRDDASLAATFKGLATAHQGRLHAVLHAVAYASPPALRGPLLGVSRADFADAHDVSAYSLIALARGAAPLLQGGGSITALSYQGASRVVPAYGLMGPAKASLETTAMYLAAELGPTGIRVNVLSAGPVDTLASRGIRGFTELRDAAAAAAPLRRGVTLEEVGAAATYLASDGAAGVTGTVLRVDAGLGAMA